MVGDEPDAEIPPEDIPLSFNHKPLFKRFLIVAAGPFSNLLLAVVIFFGLFLITGIPVLNPVIGKIDSGSPAAQAGIQISDRVTAINGRTIDSWETMAGMIASSQGRDLTFTLLRQDQSLDVVVTPQPKPSKNIFGEPIDRYVIGVMSSGDVHTRKLSFVEALSESLVQTYKITELTALSVIKLIQGTVSTKTLGGPIMIAEMAGQQAKEGISQPDIFYRPSQHQSGYSQFSAHSRAGRRSFVLFFDRSRHPSPLKHSRSGTGPAGRHCRAGTVDDSRVLQ